MSYLRIKTCSEWLVLKFAVEKILIVEVVNLIHKDADEDKQNEREDSSLNKSTC